MKRIIFYVALLVFVSGCASVYRNHGYAPSEDDLAMVIVGVDTRASVIETLGQPRMGGATNQSGIYYVASRWRHFGAARPKPVEREVVAITFDRNDVVQNIARYGLEDGNVVVINRRVTEGGLPEISFIRQLMGNLGRFDAGQFLGRPDG